MKLSSLPLMTLVAGSATCANAAVVSFEDVDIGIPTTFAGVSVNLETGVFADDMMDLSGVAGGGMNFVFGGEWITNDADGTAITPRWQPVRIGSGSPSNSDVIRNLGIGEIVGPGSAFATGYGGSTGHIAPPPSPAAPNETFEAGERGFIGFSLLLSDNTTTAYGWVEVTLYDDGVTEGIIHGWAYQDDGTPLAVGAIPEPSQTVLLGLSALGLALRRRRAS